MSWLNFNESLNSIKGQLSSFASGVLAEGIINETEDGINDSSILTSENLENQQEIATLELPNSQHVTTESENNWNWEPPGGKPPPTIKNGTAIDVQKKIEILEGEKKELITSLEQLDFDYQQTTDKLVMLKDNLQAEYNELKMNFESLQKGYGEVLNENLEKTKKIELLEGKNRRVTTDKNLQVGGLFTDKLETDAEVFVKFKDLKEEYDDYKRTSEKEKVNAEELQKLCRKLEDDNANLCAEIQGKDRNSHDSEVVAGEEDVIRQLEDENMCLIRESEGLSLKLQVLMHENEELRNINVKLKDDYEVLKIESIKLQSALGDLQNYSEELKETNAKLEENFKAVKNSNELVKKEYDQLSGSYEGLKISSKQLKSDLERLQKVNAEVKKEYHHLKSERNKALHGEEGLQVEYDTLKVNHEKIIKEKETLHEKYISIITENMQKYMNSSVPSKMSPLSHDEQPQISEFAGKVETLLRLLLDFKSKTETLEKELCEVAQEKTNTIAEKNFEIEKLLQNSEILSQEVITKTQAIKDYEEECAELMKNNDVLISELQNYKNNSGLQTISESNEDNMLLLESQLENANKRIQDLELIVSDLENSKQETNLETQTELEYIKKQLNMTGQELSHSKEEYQKLSGQYERLEGEKHYLKATLDKIKMDYENTEYKYTEINVGMETLKEENEEYKSKIVDLDTSSKKVESLNYNLESKIELLQNVVEDVKQKLELELENTKQKEAQIQNLVERLQNSKMCETGLKLQVDTIYKELQSVSEAKQNLEMKHNKASNQLDELQRELQNTNEECALLKEERSKDFTPEMSELQTEFSNIKIAYNQTSENAAELQRKVSTLEKQLDELTNARNELITLVTTKHQENVQYHGEIQRLSQLLTAETEKSHLLEMKLHDPPVQASNTEELFQKNEMEKLTDQNAFLREKCELLAQNLLREQSNVQKVLSERSSASEREQALAKELERLRIHLVEIEETYTQELVQAEQKNKEMQAKVNEIEQREKDSSSIYTSVSIRANQQVETLQTQLQLVTSQRDELRVKISDGEDENNKHVAALTNLQLVLEQFQKDKDKDVLVETERIRRRITTEKEVQKELRTDIGNLRFQLEESKQGLQAASRLTDQLEKCKQQVVNLKDEVAKLQEQLKKSEKKQRELSTQTDLKVDKTLIKNLVIGYIASSTNDQNQILKIIATVLDFSQKESDKVQLTRPQQEGWLNSILHPQSLNSTREMTQQSLSEAFVRFLENESKPKVLPNLLTSNQPKKIENSDGSTSSTSSRQSPLVLNEVVLPTFTDFGKNRNSSSILKDVLKDNT